MTHRTTIYLADVHDHMEYILTSIEMFASVSENLINFSFNVSDPGVFHYLMLFLTLFDRVDVVA